MAPRPKTDRGYGAINGRGVTLNVGVRYREHHKVPGRKYRLCYRARGGDGEYNRPQEDPDVHAKAPGTERAEGGGA